MSFPFVSAFTWTACHLILGILHRRQLLFRIRVPAGTPRSLWVSSCIARSNLQILHHTPLQPVVDLRQFLFFAAEENRDLLQRIAAAERTRQPFFTSIEKLISGWVASHAEVNLAKRYLEVTLTNIFQDIDMLPTVNYNVNALPMRRIGQH